jgi:hypothetical protein
MKTIKVAIIWLVLGLVLGLWFGINIGRDRPFYSNPFEAPSLQEKMKQAGEGALEKGGDALESAGKAIKEKLKK